MRPEVAQAAVDVAEAALRQHKVFQRIAKLVKTPESPWAKKAMADLHTTTRDLETCILAYGEVKGE